MAVCFDNMTDVELDAWVDALDTQPNGGAEPDWMRYVYAFTWFCGAIREGLELFDA